MPSFFGTNSIPQTEYIKTTLENLCALLASPIYDNGIDRDGVVNMMEDLYRYIAVSKNKRIRCPAPVDDPEDKYRVMWPEGAKVHSRPTSNASSRGFNINRLSTDHSTGLARKRAASVTSSSKFKSKYVGIIDEEDTDHDTKDVSRSSAAARPHRHRDTSSRQREKSSNTLRVGGAVIKPSTSMQDIAAGLQRVQVDDNVDVIPAQRPLHRTTKRVQVSNNVNSGSAFADDE